MTSSANPRVLIVGLGPTGLGAAVRLRELGVQSYTIVEASDAAAGLSRSVTDDKGFVWDIGGHVVFSHYQYYDDVLEQLGPEQTQSLRVCKVYYQQGKVEADYPLQSHLHQLPESMNAKCVEGIKALQKTAPSTPTTVEDLPTAPSVSEASNKKDQEAEGSKDLTMEEWGLKTFGEGLMEVFVRPYNFKVWAHVLQHMSASWVAQRVAPVTLLTKEEIAARAKAAATWGPNNTIRYPKCKGIGHIFESIAKHVGPVMYNTRVTDIDLASRVVTIEKEDKTRGTLEFDYVISTANIKRLVEGDHISGLRSDDDRKKLGLAKNLVYSSTNVVGLGVKCSADFKGPAFHWAYFPESDCPFYRCVVMTNLSKQTAPNPEEGDQIYYSLLFEISESDEKPVPSLDVLVEQCVESSLLYGMIKNKDDIVSKFSTRVNYGYPTPAFGFEGIVDKVIPMLDSYGMMSRGRFGGWKYEVGNMDHSFMQGVEAADQALADWVTKKYRFKNSDTYYMPGLTNSRSNKIGFSGIAQ